MAFLAQTNPQDDQTEQTGQINPIISNGSQDVNLSPAPLNATQVAPPADFNSTDPNATKGTGFTNIQKYLNANQTGASNLGTQVAGSINDQTNQAQAAVGKVSDLATSNPTADIWNSQEDTNAQQAITNANQKAALTANVGGQSQLIRDIAPGTSTGGVNLDQFLMQQGGGYGQVANAAQNAAGLQGDYANKSNQWQNNATTAQALRALQQQATSGQGTGPVTVTTPSTSQVPNTSSIGANTDTGATTNNPYLGLSPDQIAYLKSLQAKNSTVGTTNPTGTINPSIAAPIAATGLLNRGTISKTANATTTGGKGAVNVTGTDTGGFTDQSDQRYSIDANGNVTPNDTGISNSTAGTIGKVASVLTGIPGLSLLGAYLNNKINSDAQAAADAAAAERATQNLTTGGAMNVGGDQPAAGEAAAQANAGNVTPTTPTPTTPDQTAAAIASGNDLSPAEQVQAAQQAAADQAAQQAQQEAANQAAYAAAVQQAQEQAAQQQAAAEQAAAQAASEQAAQQAASEQAAAQAASEAATQASSEQSTQSTSESAPSAPSSSSSDKDGGYISGPGGPRTDSIPIHVSNGEFVINAAVVKALGRDFFERLNNSVKGK